MKTLKLLQDYANSSNNTWLSNQLNTLESDFNIELKDSEDRIKSYYNNVIL